MTDKNEPLSISHEDAVKLLKKQQADYQLHVLLIQKQDRLTKAVAQIAAWNEGAGGLAKRLAKN